MKKKITLLVFFVLCAMALEAQKKVSFTCPSNSANLNPCLKNKATPKPIEAAQVLMKLKEAKYFTGEVNLFIPCANLSSFMSVVDNEGNNCILYPPNVGIFSKLSAENRDWAVLKDFLHAIVHFIDDKKAESEVILQSNEWLSLFDCQPNGYKEYISGTEQYYEWQNCKKEGPFCPPNGTKVYTADNQFYHEWQSCKKYGPYPNPDFKPKLPPNPRDGTREYINKTQYYEWRNGEKLGPFTDEKEQIINPNAPKNYHFGLHAGAIFSGVNDYGLSNAGLHKGFSAGLVYSTRNKMHPFWGVQAELNYVKGGANLYGYDSGYDFNRDDNYYIITEDTYNWNNLELPILLILGKDRSSFNSHFGVNVLLGASYALTFSGEHYSSGTRTWNWYPEEYRFDYEDISGLGVFSGVVGITLGTDRFCVGLRAHSDLGEYPAFVDLRTYIMYRF